jgi:hypothetical protein
MGWYMAGPPVAADGYVVSLNGYDNRLYCFGKGQTATTVSAPDVAIPQGTPVLLQGTIKDQSPGAAGSPAISDDSMSAWMEYLYMQQLKPSNATGVKVHLTAIDPNNNWQDIGTATSDTKGNYAITWTPPVPGLYKVTATFEGSNSYFKSEAGTAFVVSQTTPASAAVSPTPAPLPTAPPVLTPTPVVTSPPAVTATPFVTTAPTPAVSFPATEVYIASAAVIIIVIAAIAAIALRRRK